MHKAARRVDAPSVFIEDAILRQQRATEQRSSTVLTGRLNGDRLDAIASPVD